MEDVRDDFPQLYKRSIKKSGNEFITEVHKLGDTIYKKMEGEDDKELLDFYTEVVNFGINFRNWMSEL